MTMYRQGDVLLIPTTSIPEDSIEINRTDRGLILAEGEVTGHAHRIVSRHAKLYRTETDDRYLRVMGPAPRIERVLVPESTETVLDEDYNPVFTDKGDPEERVVRAHEIDCLVAAPEGVVLEHEEHSVVVLPLGNYRVVIHTEYVPGALPRRVED